MSNFSSLVSFLSFKIGLISNQNDHAGFAMAILANPYSYPLNISVTVDTNRTTNVVNATAEGTIFDVQFPQSGVHSVDLVLLDYSYPSAIHPTDFYLDVIQVNDTSGPQIPRQV